MGTYTSRLKLFQVNPVPASDNVDVAIDHNAGFDIVDDNASITSRAAGTFPPVSDSYVGRMVFHAATRRIYNFWDDNTYRAFKHVPSYINVANSATQTVANNADTTINWGLGAPIVTTAMDLGTNSNIVIKQAGTYMFHASARMADAGTYEHYMAIEISPTSAFATQLMRTSENVTNTSAGGAKFSVGGIFNCSTANVGANVRALLFQRSGVSKNFAQDAFTQFTAVRLGGYFGDQ